MAETTSKLESAASAMMNVLELLFAQHGPQWSPLLQDQVRKAVAQAKAAGVKLP